MKKKTIIYSIVAVVLSMFLASVALAECPGGMSEITIVNPAGKVIEICVPDDVARDGNIGGGEVIVISATCPGYTQEEVAAFLDTHPDATVEQYDGSTTTLVEPCTYVEIYDPDSEVIISALEGPDETVSGDCRFREFDLLEAGNNQVYNDLTGYSNSGLSEEEGDACVAILNTFL